MENNKISKGENHLIRINSSFDEDINKVDDIFEDKSLHDFEFKFEKEKNLAEKMILKIFLTINILRN